MRWGRWRTRERAGWLACLWFWRVKFYPKKSGIWNSGMLIIYLPLNYQSDHSSGQAKVGIPSIPYPPSLSAHNSEFLAKIANKLKKKFSFHTQFSIIFTLSEWKMLQHIVFFRFLLPITKWRSSIYWNEQKFKILENFG